MYRSSQIWVPKATRVRRAVGGLRRRAFLGGGAAVVGLPFLESLVPKSANGQNAAAVRLGYVFVPNGLDMATFRPSTTGADYSMPPMLASLESLRQSFSVITGLDNLPGIPDGAGDHASGTAAFITAAKANKSETNLRLGISADQIAANAFGDRTRLASLQLGTDGNNACDNGYSCAYGRNISWANETTPLAYLKDPAQVFNSIFQGFDSEATEAEQAARAQLEGSVLDTALRDALALEPKLGVTDRMKLEQYLEGVRELERRVTSSGAASARSACTQGESPAALNQGVGHDEHVRLLTDLLVTAWQCDATRIVSFMFGDSSSKKTHPWLNSFDAHHDISHHAGDGGKISQLASIGRWEMEIVSHLFARLDEIEDGPDGESMLYNSAIYVSSDVSDGDAHNHDDMPVILGGHAGGALQPGRHIAYTGGAAAGAKTSNLLVTMLSAAGVDGSLGDSDGSGSLLPEV